MVPPSRSGAAHNSLVLFEGGAVQAPWPFKEGEGSSCGLHLAWREFGKAFSVHGRFRAAITGGTDNMAVSKLSMRQLTTRVPPMFVLMEFLHECDVHQVRCHMDWRPRDANCEADEISKHSFQRFDLGQRLNIAWDELLKGMLESMLRFSDFGHALQALRGGSNQEVKRRRVQFEKSHWG